VVEQMLRRYPWPAARPWPGLLHGSTWTQRRPGRAQGRAECRWGMRYKPRAHPAPPRPMAHCQQRRYSPRCQLAGVLGLLPTICPFDAAHQALEIGPHTLPRLPSAQPLPPLRVCRFSWAHLSRSAPSRERGQNTLLHLVANRPFPLCWAGETVNQLGLTKTSPQPACCLVTPLAVYVQMPWGTGL
jgi:hypothetical protein